MSRAKTTVALLAFAMAASTAACASSGNSAEAEAFRAMEEALKPASAEERAAANRADPLTRANFWAKENLKNAEDLPTALEFAKALREIGSHERAIDVLSRTLIVHPDSADALMLLGRIHMAAADPISAGRAFQRAAEVAPDRAEAWAALGTAYDQVGQHLQAQDHYRRALGIEPLRTTTLTNYGLSLVLTGDLRGAEAKLRQAAANADAGPKVTENLALVLGLQGRFDEMKSVSATAAPSSVAERNAELLRGLIQPARSWEAVAGPAAEKVPAKVPLAKPAARIDTAPAEEAERRTLRGLRN